MHVTRKRLLIVVSTVAQVGDVARLVKVMAGNPTLEIIVFAQIASYYGGLNVICELNGIALFDHEGRHAGGPLPYLHPVSRERPQPFLRRAFDYLYGKRRDRIAAAADVREIEIGEAEPCEPALWDRVQREIDRLEPLLDAAYRLVAGLRPKVIVLAEDNVAAFSSRWTRTGRRFGARSLVMPYTLATWREAAEALKDLPEHVLTDETEAKVMTRLLRKWVLEYDGRKIVRLPVATAIAAEVIGLSTPRPWRYNDGHSNWLIADSTATERYYRDAGVPGRKIKRLGGLADDDISAARLKVAGSRTAAFAELGLDPAKPVLLCAFPPDQDCATRRGCEFGDFDSLCRFWLETISGNRGWNVLIRPHPALQRREMPVFDAYPVKITWKETAELIALCDVFVASISSTIRWAVAAGRPVINYDVYQYGYLDFARAPGVVTVNSRDAFVRAIAQVTGDEAYRAELRRLQQEGAPEWGMLDGRSNRRIRRFLERISGARPADRKPASYFLKRIALVGLWFVLWLGRPWRRIRHAPPAWKDARRPTSPYEYY